jgi:hypothetical protein
MVSEIYLPPPWTRTVTRRTIVIYRFLVRRGRRWHRLSLGRPPETAVARVFVSHAGGDGPTAAEAHRWLTDDGHEVFLDQHMHDGIAVGEDWERRLHERLC